MKTKYLTLPLTCLILLAQMPSALADASGDLIQAINQGHSKRAEAAIQKGADVNLKLADGSSPLHWAVRYSNKPLIELLLAKGAKLETGQGDYGGTPLMSAAAADNLAMIDFLLTKGAKLDASDANGNMPLHATAVNGQVNVVKHLLVKGAQVDSRNAQGNTALQEVAASLRSDLKGQIQVMALLIDKGADIEAPNKAGLRPLQLAIIESWNPEGPALLLARGAKLDVRDSDGKTPLMLAIAKNAAPPIISLLLNKGADLNAQDKAGRTPLMYLASVSCSDDGQAKIYADLAAQMLDRGAKLETPDAQGQTALMYAAGMLTQPEPTTGPCTSGADLLERLISRGAKVNALSQDGDTPLMFAVSRSQAKVEALLRHGAQINARDAFGGTALRYALEYPAQDSLGVVRVLLLKGADPALKDKDGQMPLSYAEAWDEPDQRLISLLKNPQLNLASRPLDAKVLEAAAGEDLAALKQALAQAKNPNAQDEAGTTALMLAARTGNSEMVKLLLNQGADPKRVDLFKQSALFYTYSDYLDSQQRMAIVKQLLASGADPKASNADGDTVLMLAVAKDTESSADDAAWLSFCQSLIVKGADLNAHIQAYPATGNTMLFEAARGQHLPLLKLLLEKGARPDAPTKQGLTPLMAAAAKDPAAVDLLLRRGANPKVQGPGGWTTLMNAAAAGADQNIRLLLAKGVPLEASYAGDENNYAGGETALLIAAANGHASTVKLLLEKGAKRDVSDKQGHTALMMASRRLGFDILGKSEYELGAEVSNRLDDTLIRGKLEVVRLLLKQGFDPNRKDQQGLTALDHAKAYAENMSGYPPDQYQALIKLLQTARK